MHFLFGMRRLEFLFLLRFDHMIFRKVGRAHNIMIGLVRKIYYYCIERFRHRSTRLSEWACADGQKQVRQAARRWEGGTRETRSVVSNAGRQAGITDHLVGYPLSLYLLGYLPISPSISRILSPHHHHQQQQQFYSDRLLFLCLPLRILRNQPTPRGDL